MPNSHEKCIYFCTKKKTCRAFTKYLGTIEELKQKPVDQIPDEESIVIPAPKANVISPRMYIWI